MHKPAFQLKHPIPGFAIYLDPFAEAEQCPESPITKRRMQFDQMLNAPGQDFVEPRRYLRDYRTRRCPNASI
jgi:hypothetical protein